jgi:hypothetical protein
MRTTTRAGIALLALTLCAGCVILAPPERRETVVVKPGPPPHAPAHGYRHKLERDSVELLFDSGLGVYVVVDLADVFFYEGHYYRCEGERWFISPRPRDGWLVVAVAEVPGGLRAHKAKGKPKGGPGKGNGKKH